MRRNRIGERKTLTPSEKRIHYTPAPGETFSQLPIRTNFIPVLPSCEKWQLKLDEMLLLRAIERKARGLANWDEGLREREEFQRRCYPGVQQPEAWTEELTRLKVEREA